LQAIRKGFRRSGGDSERRMLFPDPADDIPFSSFDQECKGGPERVAEQQVGHRGADSACRRTPYGTEKKCCKIDNALSEIEVEPESGYGHAEHCRQGDRGDEEPFEGDFF
jgi:hypothetical protein